MSVTRRQFVTAGMAGVLALAISACKSDNQATEVQSTQPAPKTVKITARCNLTEVSPSIRKNPAIIVLTGCCAKSEGHTYYVAFNSQKDNYVSVKDIEVVSGKYKLTTIVGTTKDNQCVTFEGFDFDYSDNCPVVLSDETKDEYLERKSKETGKPKGLIASDVQDTQWLDGSLNLIARLSKCDGDYTSAYKQLVSDIDSGKVKTEQVFGISIDELKSLQI